jgi:hypothetical protein
VKDDLFRAVLKSGEPFRLIDWVREVLTVPETMNADDVLNEMRNHHTHHAVVIDEYGGTAGLVTFAGLMERIVGEVGSDFGPAGSRISPLPDGRRYRRPTHAGCRCSACTSTVRLPTIGGYVLGRLGRRARLGEARRRGRILRVRRSTVCGWRACASAAQGEAAAGRKVPTGPEQAEPLQSEQRRAHVGDAHPGVSRPITPTPGTDLSPSEKAAFTDVGA